MDDLDQWSRLDDECCRHVLAICAVCDIYRIPVQVRLDHSIDLFPLKRVLLGNLARIALCFMSLILEVGLSFQKA